jgi:hypothetical protein
MERVGSLAVVSQRLSKLMQRFSVIPLFISDATQTHLAGTCENQLAILLENAAALCVEWLGFSRISLRVKDMRLLILNSCQQMRIVGLHGKTSGFLNQEFHLRHVNVEISESLHKIEERFSQFLRVASGPA